MFKRVGFHRFKQFHDEVVELKPSGVTLLAGGNNAGKSSVLHGLAVWQFCRTAIEMERGTDAFLSGSTRQGLGLGDDEFSPIDVPSLKHLWTNLATQRDAEPDGYTLKIRCAWGTTDEKHLEFGLSLANDRLFVKATDSNLAAADTIPTVAYLPPFAGITAHETRLPGAIRRRRIGEGLAGAVLRNLLLDLFNANTRQRAELRANRSKIRDADLRDLRETDPWELLQATLRETFGAELLVVPFSEEYHSYISVEVDKGSVDGFKLKRHANYRPRDLMVEGGGFLQWLSVFALALDPSINVLLLDEPDAHLHASLQDHLVARLADLAVRGQKQILIATHSTEIIRAAPPETILEFRKGRAPRYLRLDAQKSGLLAGLGSDYAPRIDRLRRSKRMLFLEGSIDSAVLKTIGEKVGLPLSSAWVEWLSSSGQKERRALYRELAAEVPGLVAVSLRDRDDEPPATVGPGLEDLSISATILGFHARKWRRRHLETYLLWPPAIAEAAGLDPDEVEERMRNEHGVAITRDNFVRADAPDAIKDLRGKAILKEGDAAILGQIDASANDVARCLPADLVPDDLRTFLTELKNLEPVSDPVPRGAAASRS